MLQSLGCALLVCVQAAGASGSGAAALVSAGQRSDWLLAAQDEAAQTRAELVQGENTLTLQNGLVRRSFRLKPAFACVELDDLRTDASLLRSVRPEAELVLDGARYAVGGLQGQPNHAWLDPRWIEQLEPVPDAFQLVSWEQGPTVERFPWGRVRHAAPDSNWPPPGLALHLIFEHPKYPGARVGVHYELYDGLPLFAKWLTLENNGVKELELDRCTVELLAIVEHSSHVEYRDVPLPHPGSLHVETDYAFGGFNPLEALRHSVHWVPDPLYATQVNYLRQNPCLLRVEPTHGPDVLIAPGASFTSFRAFELLHDSTERERRGLAQRRMMRALAPWVTENPLILHVVSTDDQIVRTAIDQAAECGFEMVSLSFGSGLNMEDESPKNHAKFKQLADYAAERGIALGGYSLLSSRRIEPDSDNCVNPTTGAPGGGTHGFCPALASAFGQAYFKHLQSFFEATGFAQFTHDGSYPGDLDAAARAPLQRGAEDSRWVQWQIITRFYQELRAGGVYLRVPDYYYLAGSNECGMGYRETNWSLPRAQQLIHTRQNIFDGTWEKTPSMGWMFVPLTQYHGGGEAATIEPLDEHLEHYERMLQSNLAFGVQAAYRGHRLYDTERVRLAVTRWVEWYKRYRDILESDLIHGRRADGRDLDWMLHVNPKLAEKGLLVVFNPLDQELERTLSVELYYTGLRDTARVSPEDLATVEHQLDDTRLELNVRVPARGMRWFVLR